MAKLQDEIFNIQEYFRSIEYYGKGLIVKVEFPPKWSVYPSSDGKIQVVPDDNAPNMYFYFVDLKDGKLEDVFALINETITMNINVVKKVQLMKEKMEELKELFATKTLEELAYLRFSFFDPNDKKNAPKTKRKYTKRKKKEEKVEDNENVVEEKTEEQLVEQTTENTDE